MFDWPSVHNLRSVRMSCTRVIPNSGPVTGDVTSKFHRGVTKVLSEMLQREFLHCPPSTPIDSSRVSNANVHGIILNDAE